MSTTAVKQPVAPVPSEPMTVYEFARSPEYDDKRFELIDGFIVRREEMKPAHVGATESLRHRLEPMIPTGWCVREDKPIRIPDWTEPLPDIAVVRGDYTVYRSAASRACGYRHDRRGLRYLACQGSRREM